MISRYRLLVSRWYQWTVSGQQDGQPSSRMRFGQPANGMGSGLMIGRYRLLASCWCRSGQHLDNGMDNRQVG
ncbi:hypothetical protein [Parabacteroides goldsteinii]|uniref:hypothetical protein n=1 Tax=Parabacteroides goldsteinii TaxID=328812 RepID=UPI00101B6F95|nr:hypothetical protein [Parabacteroides goldsteinii]